MGKEEGMRSMSEDGNLRGSDRRLSMMGQLHELLESWIIEVEKEKKRGVLNENCSYRGKRADTEVPAESNPSA
ncbi:MAG: hypothetical protein SCAL_000568 [Candidatus Syntrophoarchaeum caldarius]|uniref:Uncharacterized protein n=1 Tax=Candidatus Syntropharchaeum caldarium TaxID=1838285 RepID=A0A1F2P9J1_9EURY|nr:MAG: hypothetical protein SCAL_000568 [Candidatus Syntrophoarchaeum caldarius]